MRRRATVSRLVLRSVSACALPRPSATASARLAKTTVSHSHTTIVQLKARRSAGPVIAVYRVSTAPTSTTNMTGFLIWTRGSSFLKASGVDFHKVLGSSSPAAIRPFAAPADLRPMLTGAVGVFVIAMSMQSFGERAQGQSGEVGQADEDED